MSEAGEVDLTHVRRMWADDHASAHLGMELVDLGLGHATVRMTVTDTMTNGHGDCHGATSSPSPTPPSPSCATPRGS